MENIKYMCTGGKKKGREPKMELCRAKILKVDGRELPAVTKG
jgi:hypothetical protein